MRLAADEAVRLREGHQHTTAGEAGSVAAVVEPCARRRIVASSRAPQLAPHVGGAGTRVHCIHSLPARNASASIQPPDHIARVESTSGWRTAVFARAPGAGQAEE